MPEIVKLSTITDLKEFPIITIEHKHKFLIVHFRITYEHIYYIVGVKAFRDHCGLWLTLFFPLFIYRGYKVYKVDIKI